MANPALEALRQQQVLSGLMQTEGGLVSALCQSLEGRLQPRNIPADLWNTMTATTYVGPVPVPTEVERRMIASFRTRVDNAVPYWVENDMADVVIHAAESRPTAPIHDTDLPCETGFVWFDGGAEVGFVDQFGVLETMMLTCMLWSRTASGEGKPGIWVTYWSDPRHPKDELFNVLKANPETDPFQGLRGFGFAWSGFIPFAEDVEHVWWQQVAATFFHLIAQPTVASGPVEPDKQIKRWIEREPKPIVANTVTVVTLRRQKTMPDDNAEPRPGTGVERKVKVRFMVGEKTGGFWRNYHTKDGVQPRWIMPYVAGPDGAPFVWRRIKVYAWRR